MTRSRIGIHGGPGSIQWGDALLAWNPVMQTEGWRVALAHSRNGGILTIAGDLVFQADGDGVLLPTTPGLGTRCWRCSPASAS